MAQTLKIDAPSGLVVTVREFKTRDEDWLSDPEVRRSGLSQTKLLEACLVSVDETGPHYRLDSAGKLPWAKVLQGDRTEIMRRNIVYSWGPEGHTRDDCPRCELSTESEFDLSTLPVKLLPASSIEHVGTGKPISILLPRAGVRVGFRLLRGENDKALEQIKKLRKNEQSSRYHELRLVDIEGVPPEKRLAWIQDLGAADSSFLRAAYDDADCGVDTSARFKCEHCGHEWEDDLVLVRFLFPKWRGRTATSPQ